MRVLIVCSGNNNRISPYIVDQVLSLNELEICTEYYVIVNKGAFGYLKNLKPLKNKIKTFKPDVIHAHYGLSGLIANLQRKTPVVVTFHGSDINFGNNRFFSRIAFFLSAKCIFVSEKLAKKLTRNIQKIIPCGVDLSIFKPLDKNESKRLLGLNTTKKYILFPGSYNNYVKNYQLAKKALHCLNSDSIVEMIELKGYSRMEVSTLLNAVDLVLMTSFSEGSPQVIKEALACNCPVISTDVGDISVIINKMDGCYITSNNPIEISNKIKDVLAYNRPIKGVERILELGLDSISTSKKIFEIYKEVLSDK
ncbi:MAG TPA: glycosyltransferase [Bacteroidales bacterium]|nr:glycosyltransferase [Bacteroidales bacterium]